MTMEKVKKKINKKKQLKQIESKAQLLSTLMYNLILI